MGWSRYFRRRYWDAERALELEAYLEAETAENIARGMPAGEARHAARRKLGNPTRIREEVYHMNSMGHIEAFWQDLRYAFRVLRKSKGFAIVAILSLALGIGANSTVYSVIHAVLLRSLPYPDANRLVRVQEPGTGSEVNLPELDYWRQHASTFASSAGFQGTSNRLLVAGEKTVWMDMMPVTTDFFRTLGVVPALGRELQPEETRQSGPRAVVLTNSAWQRVFGSDSGAVGRVVTIDNASYTVAGVLPASFWFPQAVDAFVPLRSSGTAGDTGTNTEMIARLKPGVGLARSQAEMTALSEAYRSTLTDAEGYHGLTAGLYQDWLVGDVRKNLLLLFGAVGLLLLIACFNLASLLLARLASRQKEIAMRLALGSSRGRLLRQFLIENTLITLAGGLVGVIAARALLDTLVAAIPFDLHASGAIQLDLPVLGFTLAVALVTGAAFSVAPMLTSSRLDLQETLKAGGRPGGTGARQRARSALVISEVALSVTLLVAAGLLIQSLYRMHQEHLGFNPHGLITFATPATAQQSRNIAALHLRDAALLEHLRALPGVQAAAATSVLPLTSQNNYPSEREGHPDQDIGGMEIRVVTPTYFETMGTPIVLGRAFNARDTATSTAVVLVNESVARRWWGTGSPLGDRVVVGRMKGRDLDNGDRPREVVGVVGDTKTVYLKQAPRPTVYLLREQTAWYDGDMNWVVRGSLSTGIAEQVRRVVAEVDSRQRVELVRTMDEIVDATTADSRFNAWIFGSFAGLALVLAAIGVYGLLAFSVARRTNEIGTRMALGATREAVLGMILKQGIGLIVTGLVVGLAGAVVVTRSLESLLFGVKSTDPASLIGVSLLLMGVGLLASYFPARRATRVDPMVALRDE